MTELTREIASVPRNAQGERIGEKRQITVGDEDYDIWIVPMSIGDQFEFNEQDFDLNDFTEFENVAEMYRRFLGDRTKENLAQGEEFVDDDIRDLKLMVATAIIQEISRAAGVEMSEDDLEELERTLEEEAAAPGN